MKKKISFRSEPKLKIMEEITYFKSGDIKDLINRERSNLKIFYDNYASKLFGIISLLVENKEVREEILQKTFIRIFFEGKKYDPVKSTVFIWMLNITIEITSEHLRVELIEMQKKFCTHIRP